MKIPICLKHIFHINEFTEYVYFIQYSKIEINTHDIWVVIVSYYAVNVCVPLSVVNISCIYFFTYYIVVQCI